VFEVELHGREECLSGCVAFITLSYRGNTLTLSSKKIVRILYQHIIRPQVKLLTNVCLVVFILINNSNRLSVWLIDQWV